AHGSHARAGVLHTPHGSLETPFFCVVGTAGSVKGVTPAELRELGAGVLLANTYHLLLRPGAETVRDLGGLHQFMAWDGPIVTDSGGFQVFSLGFGLEHGVGKQIGMFPGAGADPNSQPRRARGQAARLVRVDEDGATFTSHVDGARQRLTPESSIAIQEALGADIILAFDEPTSPLHHAEYTRAAMERTHRWAERCLAARQQGNQALYGIVQGGAFADLRTASAQFIGGLPFDGVAIGGSLGKSKSDMHAVIDWARPHVPEAWPRHLLGIGEPEDLFACVELGIDQFDCVAPTRLGRHGQLYTPDGRLHISRPELKEDPRPIQTDCGCYTCRTGFSRGYIRHLFAANELLGYTLASLHNLYFILELMSSLRKAIREDRLADLKAEFLARYSVPTPAITPHAAGGQ
ncbi:MAG: tRNA guanosine(34) transglycosylase Tgt, partial [Chloroflexi bacterium]|nr:tRNA guanosine(34) transglycosylase Tgt [Chloroflexota bacterium]